MPPTALYGLSTLDDNLEPPPSRVQDASSLRGVARRLIIDDEPRSRERAITRGLLQGNPPYNPAKRKAANQAWMANLNFLEGEASIDSARVPYYQIFSGVKEYVTCRTKLGDDEQTRTELSAKISKNLHKLFKGWPEFDWHIQNCTAEMLRWGYAPLVYDPDPTKWKFKSVESRCVMVPKDTASIVDDRTVVILLIEVFTISELWDKIRDEKAAESAGWNVEAVKRAIQQAGLATGNAQTPWTATPWEEWEVRLKNNDLYWTTNGQQIYTYRALVQEFRKDAVKISQFIVTQNPVYDNFETGAGGTVEQESDDAGFLFRHIDRYDSYNEALILFFQNTGYGTWHSVRGMAMKGFKHWDASNRLKCKALDAAFQRCAIVLQTDTIEAQDNLQLMVFSDRTILPRGTKVAQTGFAGDTEGVMAVDRMLTNHLANNLGVYNQRTMSRDDGRGEMPTATQVQNQVMKEANLSQGQISIFYTALDQLYRTTFEKVVRSSEPDAKAFRDACEEDGVPLEALQDMDYVIANRESGFGSSAMRQQNLQQFLPLVPSLPEQGKSNFIDMQISATLGVDKVDVLNPKTYIPKEDDSVAAAENGTAAAGSTPMVSSGNDNVRHIQIHLQDVAQRMAPIQQGMDAGQDVDPQTLQTAFDYLQIMGPHIEQHLQPLLRDPLRKGDPLRRSLAQEFEAQLKQLVSFNGKLRNAILNAKRQAELNTQQQQNATALTELDQARVQSAQVTDKIKVDKWQTDKAIKINKAQLQNRLDAFKTVHGTTLDDYQTASGIQQDKLKTQAAVKNA